jgi:putative hydrolase of the HAD superfamily
LEAQQKKVLALGLDTAVEMVVLTGLWGQEFWKPHPRAFEYVQQQIGAPASCCVYIGDNPAKDFVAPRRLGWHTIRVRRRGGLHFEREAQAGCSADHEVHDLREAASLVLNHVDRKATSLTL